MSLYTTLFFDLDNTILDFTATEKSAIKGLLKKHGLGGTDSQAARYSKINQMHWEMYERKEITKDQILTGRFKTFVESEGFDFNYMILAEDYFNFLSVGHDLVKDAIKVLNRTKNAGYTLCATTNGILKTQTRRIKLAHLDEVFDYIVISEAVNCQKPNKEYFEKAMEIAKVSDKSKILIIGDSQSSDILGGINAGIDTCWYNPNRQIPKYESRYEIHTLLDLLDILNA